jgi:hypothetical protein
MPSFNMSEFRTAFGRVMGAPSDIRLVAERIRDHALDKRLSPEETRAIVANLGYENLDTFCAAIGLPSHIARRWDRFGVSSEMKQVFELLVDQRRRMAAAVDEFESMTHVGIDDFLRERGLM